MQDGCEYSMTEIRSVLASMGIGPRDLAKDVGVLSGGEVIKLLLAKMLLGRYNILVMDEPGNYLDIKSAEALEQMMSCICRNDSVLSPTIRGWSRTSQTLFTK